MKPPYYRIKFTKTLTEPASGDHPTILFAKEGETGLLSLETSREGHWAKVENQPHWFGVREDEYQLIEEIDITIA